MITITQIYFFSQHVENDVSRFASQRVRNSENKFIRDALNRPFLFFLAQSTRRKRRSIDPKVTPFVFRHSETYRLVYLRWKIHSFVTIDAIRAICASSGLLLGSSTRVVTRVCVSLRKIVDIGP